MKVKDVFKKYPENKPSYSDINYVTIIEYKGTLSYGITYFDGILEFIPTFGKIVAFTEVKPEDIFNNLND